MSIDPTVVRRRCADLGGIVRTHELTAAGIDQYSIKKAVRVGALVRVRDGLYVDPDLPADITAAPSGASTGHVPQDCGSSIAMTVMFMLRCPATGADGPMARAPACSTGAVRRLTAA